jgi:hypothetical protein
VAGRQKNTAGKSPQEAGHENKPQGVVFLQQGAEGLVLKTEDYVYSSLIDNAGETG